jgi:hypothetical protein
MRRPSNELVRDAVKILTAHGFEPTVNTGKHIKLIWFAHGQRRMLTISKSPSDWRARMRSRMILRRLMNKDVATAENSRRT